MRNTRKWLVLLLTLAMLMNTVGFTAMAAEDESPIVLQVSHAAESGPSLQVRITAAAARTVADGKLVVTYDAAKLTYADAEAGSAWPAGDQFAWSVNPKAGEVILTFANADYAAEGVLFTLSFTVAEAGDSVIAIDGGSSYISGVDADLTAEVSTCPSAHFVDVQTLFTEAHDAVDYMVSNGYMNGMSNTMFGPHVDLNRAMMVTILYRIAGNPDVEGAPAFTDVPAGTFYTDAVVWATGNGITNGVSANLFAPGKSLTRQELVTFLHRFAKVMGYELSGSADLSAYTDAAQVQPYAVEAFQWAVANGIIKGTTETTLSPEATTTRAQVCLMVYRMLARQD